MLTVTPSVEADLVVDIDLTSPTSPVFDLDSATNLGFGLLISATNVTGALAVGPLGIFITRGMLQFGASDDLAKPATFSIGLDPSTPRYAFSSLSFGSGGNVTTTVDGAVAVDLPLAAPTASTPLSPDLTLSIPDLGAFFAALTGTGSVSDTISFTTPDLTSLIDNLDLLGNTDGLLNKLNLVLTGLSTVLNSKLLGLDIPFVGSSLQKAGQFLTELQSDFDSISGASGKRGRDPCRRRARPGRHPALLHDDRGQHAGAIRRHHGALAAGRAVGRVRHQPRRQLPAERADRLRFWPAGA